MATGKALNGKPYAGNPHVRFDEGEVAPAATPRRGSLLYKSEEIKRLVAKCENTVVEFEGARGGLSCGRISCGGAV